VGRIERTLFTLDWLESLALRRACQAGLNKGEARHALAQAVYAHRQGRFADRTIENQEHRASGLNLVIAAIASRATGEKASSWILSPNRPSGGGASTRSVPGPS